MISGNKTVRRFEFLEIVVAAGSTSAQQFFFPDYPQLRGAKAQYLTAYNAQILPVTPSNIPTISASDLDNGFLVLVINDKEDIKIPLNSLINHGTGYGVNSTNYQNINGYLPLNDLIVHWSKSYIKFTGVISGSQFTIALGLFWQPLD